MHYAGNLAIKLYGKFGNPGDSKFKTKTYLKDKVVCMTRNYSCHLQLFFRSQKVKMLQVGRWKNANSF